MKIKDIYIAAYLIMMGVSVDIQKNGNRALFVIPKQAESLVNNFYSNEKSLVAFANTLRNLKARISNTVHAKTEGGEKTEKV
jgi:hypothetical protein